MSNESRETGALRQEFSARQQARKARRAIVAERERRINEAIMTAACILLGAAALYLGMFWAGL